MSLMIDPDEVTSVLLADGWHDVDKGSFYLDSYEYVYAGDPDKRLEVAHGGGQSGVCATGFQFTTALIGSKMSGPLTAIQAVRHL